MNKKISLGLCLSLIVLSVTATFAITMSFSKQIYNGIISNLSQRSHSYESAEEINRLISNYFYGDLAGYNNNLGASVSEGYVNGLNDESSYYMTSDDYTAYLQRVESGTVGIGIETLFDYTKNQLVITYVYEGSSAESEGLQEGDVITAVGGTAVTRANYVSIQKYFTGNKMTSVQIEYLRNKKTKVVQPISSFDIPSIISDEINGVGYVRIKSFYKNTATELKDKLTEFKNDGVEAVVIDLRNTSDGTMPYAAKTLDVILPTINGGNIAIAKDKNGKTRETFTADNSSFSMSFAVLVNGNTRGPAELFACDMRDVKQAKILGTLTAGVGTMQEVFTLADGSAICLTTALIIPKAGENAVYDGIGIIPDMDVTIGIEDANIDLLSEDQDTQLNAAINMLSQ